MAKQEPPSRETDLFYVKIYVCYFKQAANFVHTVCVVYFVQTSRGEHIFLVR